MADGDPDDGLWNWAIAERLDGDLVRGAIAGMLERSVVPLGAEGEVLCDVYPVDGDFPTLVDVYLAPSGVAEAVAASAVAVRLDAAILLPDDSLDPSRYVLAEPDGTLRGVHVDEEETDDGVARRRPRPCVAGPVSCAGSGCGSGPDDEREAAA